MEPVRYFLVKTNLKKRRRQKKRQRERRYRFFAKFDRQGLSIGEPITDGINYVDIQCTGKEKQLFSILDEAEYREKYRRALRELSWYLKQVPDSIVDEGLNKASLRKHRLRGDNNKKCNLTDKKVDDGKNDNGRVAATTTKVIHDCKFRYVVPIFVCIVIGYDFYHIKMIRINPKVYITTRKIEF